MKQIEFKDNTIIVDGVVYVKREKVSIGKVKEEKFPTIQEILQNTTASEENYNRSEAFRELLQIADYYNSKFPDEKAEYVLHRYKEDVLIKCMATSNLPKDLNLYGYYKIDELMSYGDPLVTLSAAKEALRNPNVIEVLKIYLQVKD